ncbi:MAG: hypothetical protein ACFBQW_01660, partial [Sphingomonadaceae bacterium]
SGEVPPALAMMFSIPEGRARVLRAPRDAGWLVVHLSEIEEGDLEGQERLVEATRAEFNQVAGDEYAAQFARAVQKELDIDRNEAAIEALKAQLTGQTR